MATSIRAMSMFGPEARSRARKQLEGGFSLLEVMISMVILMVGLVSLLGVFGLAMATTLTSKEDMIAKQLANEAYESILTARNSSQLTWDDVQNSGSTNCPVTGAASCGIFLVPAQPMYKAGLDGIYGTSDDASAGQQTLEEPGSDGVYGSTDDVITPLTGYKRTIQFAQVLDANNNVIPTVRAVNITVQYWTSQSRVQKTYTLNSFISQFN
jgi:type II secretory pathway pseudopilin PulG